jgi:mannose-1-phosphate guanylyltransferase/mannose-6-phosphate isomerase
MIIPVVLSGGAGTRLWPLSRELYPKQLLRLVGERTLLQETLARLEGVENVGAPIVICNEAHRFLVGEQLAEIGVQPSAILLEPKVRNTAPAALSAALAASEITGDADPVLLVLPADHVIRKLEALHGALATGARLAGTGKLVTFGIVPYAPDTGYGYIKKGARLTSARADAVHAVEAFVEKPDRATAEEYYSSGVYLWNSGMFMFRAGRYIEELECFAPQIATACRQAFQQASRDLDFTRLEPEAFAACPADSIDYAVMEKTDAAAVVPLDAGWSDVGSWAALHTVNVHDVDGNVVVGDVIAETTRNSYLHASHRLLATVGIEDHVVVETADAVLVAHKDRVQDVKALVTRLKAAKRSEALAHREVHRPWGSYSGIDNGERFQVKRLCVKPGGRLSLQMHHHRAEHWVVVKGTARVTRGEDVFLLGENESTYIPMGTRHRLENPGRVMLEVVEVQSGSYLGEDDIMRFDDVYGRSAHEQ